MDSTANPQKPKESQTDTRFSLSPVNLSGEDVQRERESSVNSREEDRRSLEEEEEENDVKLDSSEAVTNFSQDGQKFARPFGSIFADQRYPVQCRLPPASKNDPEYFAAQSILADCKGTRRPVQSIDDQNRKYGYLKGVLMAEKAAQENGEVNDEPSVSSQQPKPHAVRTHQADNGVEDEDAAAENLGLLSGNQNEFSVMGKNSLRITRDELQNAVNGLNNMHLAHEIAVNHEFKLEYSEGPSSSNGLEKMVREQMTKAYWDLFDEAILKHKHNPAYVLSVFREMKELLLSLLLPHNRIMRSKIEAMFDEKNLRYEVAHDTLDFPRYKAFIAEILGQLCCPVRDREVLELRQLEKPSDVFKGIRRVVEHMQLDMANFLITQLRPSLINNCVVYERKKFAHFIDVQYRLNQDALRITRDWMSSHVGRSESHMDGISKAFADLLFWGHREWPETVMLDWVRIANISQEAKRVMLLGSVVLNAFNAARPIFGEDDQSLAPYQRGNHHMLKCFPVREALKVQLNALLTKDDCENEEKRQHAMDLLAEQAVKVTNEFCVKMMKRPISADEKETLKASVRDCARENNPVIIVLGKRYHEFAARLVLNGRPDGVDFPKALTVVQDLVMKTLVDFCRIVIHNRAVFNEMYFGIVKGEVVPPVFWQDNNNTYDPNVLKTIRYLSDEPLDVLKIDSLGTPETSNES